MPSKQNRTAFLFPGQASQSPGMGYDLYSNSPAARKVIEEIDASLGNNLRDVMFHGSDQDLTATENAQPAIAAISIATWKAMEENRAVSLPAMVAGHSLGEYSLLSITGVLSLQDTIRLIAKRSELMQNACEQNPGGMVAIIGLDDKAIEDICHAAGVHISNINSPSQVIISGEQAHLAEAIDLARTRGAKRAIRLGVGGAFHSKLMASAQEELNKFIEMMDFNDPLVPIIGNVNAEPITKAAMVKSELKLQLQSCVRWSDSMLYMANSGIDTFVEIGPGKILTGLAKRTISDCNTFSINNYEAVQSYLSMA